MNLSVLLWLPLAAAIAGLILPAREARFGALLGSLAALVYAVVMLFDFDGGAQVGHAVLRDDRVHVATLNRHEPRVADARDDA